MYAFEIAVYNYAVLLQLLSIQAKPIMPLVKKLGFTPIRLRRIEPTFDL